MPENSVNIVKREINDTQRAYERAIREKKALSIGLKSISKFDSIRYYVVTVDYKNQKSDIWIIVGKARNDGTNHIYDIMPKKK